MASSKNRVLWDFFANTKPLEKGLQNVQGGFKKTETASDKFKGALKGLAVLFGAREMAQYAGDAIKLAAAADEVDSKFDAVFGTSTRMNQALIDWGDIAGVTEADAKDLAATFGNLAQAQGISATDTQDLTLLVAELAGDMASFNDADPAQVFNDLNKALLTTEREGMKKYGIALTETEIKQEAMRIATEDGRNEFTKADKALASYNLTVKQAGKAIGDLEATQDSAANQQRQLTAELEDMKTEIGRQLMPVYRDFLKISKDIVPALGSVVGEVGSLIDAYEGLRDILKIVSGNSDGGTGGFAESAAKVTDKIMMLNPLIAATNGALKLLGKDGLGYAATQAETFTMTMDEARQAMWDAQPAAEAAMYGVGGVGAAAAASTKSLQELADQIGAAKIAMTNALPVYSEFAAAAGSVGITSLAGAANPVAAAQSQNDLQDLGGQTGG